MRHVLGAISDRVIRHRVAVQIILAVVTLVLASGVPKLELELEPEALVPEQDAAREQSALVREAFGPTTETIVVVVEAEDVTARPALEWMHASARHLAAEPWAGRVDSLTTTPLSHFVREAQPDPTLDELERDPGALEMELVVDRRMEVLAEVVATDRRRFPQGLISLSERHEGARSITAPLVRGAHVTPDEAATVRAFTDQPSPVRGRIFSANKRVALIAIALSPEAEAEGRHERASDVDARATSRIEAWITSHPPPAGVRARIGGLPEVRTELIRALRDDAASLVALACLASMAVLALGFRTVGGVVLPMAAVGMTLGMVTGAMGWAGEPINLLTNVIPPLLVTIGLGDAVHLLSRYREERARGLSAPDAARRTLESMAVACFLTSITTAVGFGSLITSQTPLLARFGALAASAVMLAYLVTLLFLPSAFASTPSFRDAPRARAGSSARQRAPWLDALLARLVDAVIARPRTVLVLGAIACAGCLSGAGFVHEDAALLDQLDPSSDSVATTRLIERELGGIRSLDVVLSGPPGTFDDAPGLAYLARIAARARRAHGVTRVESVTDWLGAAWVDVTGDVHAAPEATRDPARVRGLFALLRTDRGASIDQLVTRDGSRARVRVRMRDVGTAATRRLIEDLSRELATLPVRGFVTGEAYRATRGLDRVVSDLLSSLMLAVIVIFTILGLLFRSARLALISIPPNILPLAVVLSWMAARGIPLHAATAIVFGVSIGLAVDGTIHVLARYREEQARADDIATTVARTMRGSGRAVVIGSLALLLGFLTLLFSSFVPIRLFGELSAVAIVASLFAELTLLPALLVRFGEGERAQ